MATQIFRQQAMDRMASPDALDRPMRLVSQKQWLLLASFGLVVGFVFVSSFLVTLPVKVNGRGLLIDPMGLSEISIAYGGRVDQVLVGAGETVSAGDVVFRMTRRIKQHDVDIAEGELNAAVESAEKSSRAYQNSQRRYRNLDSQRKTSIDDRIQDLGAQLETRKKLASDLSTLVSKGAVTSLELVSVVTAIDALEENRRRLEQERLEIDLARAEREDARKEVELREQQEIQRRQLELDRLQAETNAAIDIISLHDGQIAEIKVNEGDVLAAGSSLALINQNPSSQHLRAVLFMPSNHAKKVIKGMPVEIMPSTTEKEVYGHIKAVVHSVASVAASRQGMKRLLQNDRIVDALSAAGPSIEIVAELMVADNTSGFDWSSSSGPSYTISSGTPLNAKVVVERRAIIDIILPGIREQIQHKFSAAQ